MKQGEIWLINLDPFQIRSVSQERFVKQIGIVPETIMDEIRSGLAKVLAMDIT